MRPGAFPERLLAFLLAAYALVSAWDFSARPACIDYYQFWVVGRAVAAKETQDVYSDAERKRLGELYWQRSLAEAQARKDAAATSNGANAALPPTKRLQAASQRRELETYSTPWLYALFGLASGPDYDASQLAFQRTSLLAYAAAILLLARILGFSAAASALALGALLQWFNPFVDDTLAGNVNRLQLLVLAVVLWLECRARWPGRHLAAGAILGALLAFKPNLAAVSAMLVIGWAFRGAAGRVLQSLAGQVAGVVAAVLASAAVFGSLAPWSAWAREFPRLLAAGSPAAGSAAEGNYSLARLLRDGAGVALGPALPGVLLLAVLGALAVARKRERARPGEDDVPREVLLAGVGAALSLLGAELAWQHYFVALVPLAMALLARPLDGGAHGRLRSALAAVGLAMVSLQNVGRLLDLHAPAAGAGVVAGGTLVLCLLGTAEIARPRPAAVAAA